MKSYFKNGFLSYLVLDRRQPLVQPNIINKISNILKSVPFVIWNEYVNTSYSRILYSAIPLFKKSLHLERHSLVRIMTIFKSFLYPNISSKSYFKYWNYVEELNNLIDSPSKIKDYFLEFNKNSYYLVDACNFLNQINYLEKINVDNNCVIEFGKFDFKNFNANELVLFYQLIKSFQKNIVSDDKENLNKIKIYNSIIFNLEDYFYRACIEDKKNAKNIINILKIQNKKDLQPLIREMERLVKQDIFLSFHAFIPQNQNGIEIKNLDDFKIKLHPLKGVINNKRPLKILKSAVENQRNQVGGVSSVLKSSSIAHKLLNFEKVYGFHPFYSHDKLTFKVKFIGVIKHQFNGEIVTSSIYKDVEKNEYLVQPDYSYQSIFDIGHSKAVYNSFKFSPLIDRFAYLSSAFSVFSALYCGKKGNIAVDIMQADSMSTGGLAFELMNSRIVPLIQQANLIPPKRIYLTHGLMSHYHQGFCSVEILKKIGGITKDYGPELNLTASGLIHSHLNIFVSKGVIKDALSDSPKLNMNLKEATLLNKGPEKVIGITNGIDTNSFDPCNSLVFGELALQRTYENRIESTNFLGHQNKIKKLLFDHDLIPDPKKTLFLYVGRYSDEKGIDMLPAVVEEIKKQGGQCVIMGIDIGSWSSNKIINSLKEIAKETPSLLRVYDQEIDQKGPLYNNLNEILYKLDDSRFVNKGSLIRVAASVVVVPSHSEACGLVPMEAHSSGALVIAPRIQGLIDMCIPLNFINADGIKLGLLNGANAVCYTKHKSKKQIKQAVAEAYQSLNSLTEDERNKYMQMTHSMSKPTYSWYYKNPKTDEISGAALIYSEVYHNLYHEDKIDSNVETFQEAILRNAVNL